MRRSGVTAVEVLIAATLLAVLFLPLHGLFRGAHRGARVGSDHVLARRLAYRALDQVAGLPPAELLALATGAAPAVLPADLPLDAGAFRELAIAIPDGAAERAAEDAPGEMLAAYGRSIDAVEIRVFLAEVEPGLVRLLALARWTPPFARTPRAFGATRFVSAPFHVERSSP